MQAFVGSRKGPPFGEPSAIEYVRSLRRGGRLEKLAGK